MMNTLKKVLVPLLLLLLTPMIAWTQSASENSDQFLGELLDGKYRNGFFNFSISVPPEMYVLSDQERSIYRKAGVEMFLKDVVKGRAAFEKSASQEVLIFSLAVAQPAANGVSSLNIGAVRQPEGTTAIDICDDAAIFLVRNPNYTLTSKTKAIKRAGKDFARVGFEVVSGEQTLSLMYYATMRKGYSITFVITYLSKNDLDSLEKVLESLEFSEAVS